MKNQDRLKVFFFLIIICFLGLVLRLLWIQAKQGDYYQKVALNNSFVKRKVPPTRGVIYDRNYRPLATNRSSINLYIIPAEVDSLPRYSRFLSSVFDADSSFAVRFAEKIEEESKEILLHEDVPYRQFVSIVESQNYYPAIQIKHESRRKYNIKSHFLGYVRNIGADEYQQLRGKGYSLNSFIGKRGLEKQYEPLLRGSPGYRLEQKDAFGKSLGIFTEGLQVQDGKSIVLTIDAELQDAIGDMFAGTAYKGFVGVMDASTGGLLAYVSLPQYDGNLLNQSISQDVWQSLLVDTLNPLLDRGFGAVYPPGSIFKPITASLGLEENIIDEHTILEKCTGKFRYGGNVFRCWLHRGHGQLNVIGALKNSCDVFFYDLSLRLNLENFRQFTKSCGVTVKTGVDLPGEVSGFFPSRYWYKKRYPFTSSQQGFKVNLSIGQGELQVTPLQMLAYYGALGNDGVWRQPHFLKKVEGSSQDLDFSSYPLNISANTLRIINQGLYEVVNAKKGTGSRAKLREPLMYGKTGSAQNHMSELPHVWFAGHCKYKDPTYPTLSYIVFLENLDGGGGSIAAPIAARVIRKYTKILKERHKR